MKKLIVFVLSLSLLLCGCAEKRDYDPAKMEYPGLRWGMSPEEVQGALGFSDADIVEVSEDHNEDVTNAPYWERAVGVQGVTAFGQKTTLVILGFRDYTQTGGSFGLVEVRLFYPDGYDGTQMADIQALSAELERHYGPAGEKRYWDRETDTTFDPTQEQPANTFEWNSALTGWSCLSEEEQEAGRRMFDNTENTIGTWEEFVEELNEISVYSITLQPICNYTIEVRLGHPLTEEQRRNGVTDLCITMDARNYFNRKHYAEIWLEAE